MPRWKSPNTFQPSSSWCIRVTGAQHNGNRRSYRISHPDGTQGNGRAGYKRLDEDAAERIPDQVQARTIMGTGQPAERIVQTASEEKAQMIVMATHGQSGWQRFVSGSVTERVIRQATCPIYAVPAPNKSYPGYFINLIGSGTLKTLVKFFDSVLFI